MDAIKRLESFYPTPLQGHPEAIDITPWQKVFEQILRDTWEGKIKPGELSDAHITQTYNELNNGLKYGSWGSTAENELPNPRMVAMQRNLYKFSAAKDAAMLKEINSYLYDNKGNLKTFEEFKAALDNLNIKYNKNWLEAEYRTARQSSYMAQKWNDIQANKELFPNLKYKTQEDDRVREEHAALNNIIAPIDHPFWEKYYPPNGWRCRCDAVQTAEEPSGYIPESDPRIKPEFEINVGKAGQIFNEDSKTGHRFFSLAKEDAQWPKRFELSKLEAAFNTVKTPKGNKVKVSIYADESPRNIAVAVKVADDLNVQIKVRPHIDGQIIENFKNPEYQIDKNIADRKSPEGKRLRALFRSAVTQNCSTIVFDMEKYPYSKEVLFNTIKTTLSKDENYKQISEIIIVPKEGKAEIFKRVDFK